MYRFNTPFDGLTEEASLLIASTTSHTILQVSERIFLNYLSSHWTSSK
ncbi:hypothetical protein MtrunA17_Chr5g0430491 [Medicago truncatula]|uniref:Uncharacterized protein n=1 Tax=Medicago truncatula TaxID=3880 RepID=A0A396HVK4_MEDTR|nr:hypothetical protein MtrunA17_Chr5g0430491 [Medicago truncatula]